MSDKIVLFLLFLCLGQPARGAFIYGTIKNAEPGSKVELVAPHYYIDGQSTTYRGLLDGQSQFALQVDIPEPGLAFFVFNDDRLPVFLSADDTLAIKADAFQFPVVASFSGKGGANNRLLQTYLKQNQLDFNEFNNIRFKIGQVWISVEGDMNALMESLTPELFRSSIDARRDASQSLYDEFSAKNEGALSESFSKWISAEILYSWAYNLLAFGQVYAHRYEFPENYFDFLFDAPIINETIGSDTYRQFVVAFLARQQLKTGQTDGFWSGEYRLAGELLAGKSLAFFRSDMIATAFSTERFAEILPLYSDFLQNNPFPAYDAKIEGLYEKFARSSPGSAAPAFEVSDRSGNLFTLESFRGKVLYLNFWASWCGACLRKMSFFDEFEPELTANGIVILNVSIDESAGNWEAALAEHPFKGHHVLASAGKYKNLASIYGVEAVPKYFIIGKKGLFEDKPYGNQPNDIRLKLLEISAKK